MKILLVTLVTTLVHGQGREAGGHRGDVVATDYNEYDPDIPVHNDFEEYDMIHGLYSDSDSDPNAICWSPRCKSSFGEDIVCMSCPEKRPVKKRDVNLVVSCSDSSAAITFNLSKVLTYELENLTISMGYRDEGGELMGEVDLDLDRNPVASVKEWKGLCSGTKYQFCMSFNHDHLSEDDDKLICEDCKPQGPPPRNPSNMAVSGGLTSLEVTWDPAEPICPDTKYQILVNGKPQDPPTTELTHWLSHLEEGEYEVSVRAENSEGPSADILPSSVYTIHPVTPPQNVRVKNMVVNGSLKSVVSWEPSMAFKESDFTRRGYILTVFTSNNDKSEEEEEDMMLQYDETTAEFILEESLGWNTQFTIQTYVGMHESVRTPAVPLFASSTPLAPPIIHPVKQSVQDDSLSATVAWEHPLSLEGFIGLGTLVNVWNGNKSKLLWQELIPFPKSEVTLSLSQDVPWDCEITLQTQAREEMGEETESIPLFWDIELSPPLNPHIQNSVVNDTLTATISWEHSLDLEAFKGLGTRVRVWNENKSNLVKEEIIEFTKAEVSYQFGKDLPWNSEVTLQTEVEEFSTGEETSALNLFQNIKLSTPDNINVVNLVEDGKVVANISWEYTLDLVGFGSLGTELQLISENNTVIDTIETFYPENSVRLALGEEALAWGTKLALQTKVTGEKGELTDSVPLFTSIELSAPNSFVVKHTVTEEGDLIATITWENSVMIGDVKVDSGAQGIGTRLSVLNSDLRSIKSHQVPFPTNEVNVSLTEDIPWDSMFSLTTIAEEASGEESEIGNIFSDLHLPTIGDIFIDYTVTENNYLSALISWKVFLIINSEPSVFNGLSTSVTLLDGDMTTELETFSLPHKTSSFSYPLSDPDSDWDTQFILQGINGKNVRGEISKMKGIFENFELSSPQGISVTNIFKEETLSAVVTWKNSFVESFQGLKTVVILWTGEGKNEPWHRRRRSADAVQNDHRIVLPFDQTETSFSIDTVPLDTRFSLQTAVGEWRGEQSRPQALFSEVQMEPPGEVSSTMEVVEDNLAAVISWEQPQGFEEGAGPPITLKIWNDTQLVSEDVLDPETNRTVVYLSDDMSWETKFSLMIPFSPSEQRETELINMFGNFILTPPVILNMTHNDTSAVLEWAHTMEVFSELGTIFNLWVMKDNNLTLMNRTRHPWDYSEAVFSTEGGEGLHPETMISLQSFVGNRESNHTETRFLFQKPAVFGLQISTNKLLLIIGLSILLILYILATVCCLRTVRRQGTYRVKEEVCKNGTYNTMDKFSEYNNLLVKQPPSPYVDPNKPPGSDDGLSNKTEQESLLSDSSVNNLATSPGCVFLGTSQITLNRFNDDDDFMGNFDEDGSFIGDYQERDAEEARILQNKLIGLTQLFKDQGGHLST